MRARKMLKGKAIYVNEDLCPEIHSLYNRVRNHQGVDQAWTWNGAVFGKDHKGEVFKVEYGQILEEIFK
jgi:hypothetical protein